MLLPTSRTTSKWSRAGTQSGLYIEIFEFEIEKPQMILIQCKHVIVICSVRFDIQPGREGFVDFKSGQESMVYRAKNGHLMVVSVEGSC